MAQSVSQRQRDELADAVRNIAVGQIRVQQVTLEDREEPAERYLSVEVMLSDPVAETWPSEDFFKLRKEIRNIVVHYIGADTDLQLTYVPTNEAATPAPTERPEPGDKAQNPTTGSVHHSELKPSNTQVG